MLARNAFETLLDILFSVIGGDANAHTGHFAFHHEAFYRREDTDPRIDLRRRNQSIARTGISVLASAMSVTGRGSTPIDSI
jgi:hypothetical protein